MLFLSPLLSLLLFLLVLLIAVNAVINKNTLIAIKYFKCDFEK